MCCRVCTVAPPPTVSRPLFPARTICFGYRLIVTQSHHDGVGKIGAKPRFKSNWYCQRERTVTWWLPEFWANSRTMFYLSCSSLRASIRVLNLSRYSNIVYIDAKTGCTTFIQRWIINRSYTIRLDLAYDIFVLTQGRCRNNTSNYHITISYLWLMISK